MDPRVREDDGKPRHQTIVVARNEVTKQSRIATESHRKYHHRHPAA